MMKRLRALLVAPLIALAAEASGRDDGPTGGAVTPARPQGAPGSRTYKATGATAASVGIWAIDAAAGKFYGPKDPTSDTRAGPLLFAGVASAGNFNALANGGYLSEIAAQRPEAQAAARGNLGLSAIISATGPPSAARGRSHSTKCSRRPCIAQTFLSTIRGARSTKAPAWRTSSRRSVPASAVRERNLLRSHDAEFQA